MAIDIRDDHQALIGANMLGSTVALSSGRPTAVAQRELIEFLREHGLELRVLGNFDPDKVAASVRSAVELFEGGQPSIEIEAIVSASFADASSKPAEQSVTALAVGGGILIALGVLSKLEYKDGKWGLAPGFPGFEYIASIFKSVAKIVQN